MGKRFLDAGIKTPKPLIEIDGRPVIEHIVRMFPDGEFVFICNSEHLATTPLRRVLKRVAPGCTIVEIAPHKKGPVYAVLQAAEHIADDEEVVVNYCDFGWHWDYDDFCSFVARPEVEGCIPSYKGFHPHSLGTTYYAYLKVDASDRLLELREKESFTDERMQEYASSGTYYFKKGAHVKKYFQQAMDEGVQKNGEYYVSLVYNLMSADGLKVFAYEIPYFLQWGTPEDLMEYLSWSNAFRLTAQIRDGTLLEESLSAVSWMAGAGERPFQLLEDKPVFVESLLSFPKAARYIFVLDDTQRLYGERIGIHFPGAQICSVDEATGADGAKGVLSDAHAHGAVLLAPWDKLCWWDLHVFVSMADAPLLWTFSNTVNLRRHPTRYTFLSTVTSGGVKVVSEEGKDGRVPSDAQDTQAYLGAVFLPQVKKGKRSAGQEESISWEGMASGEATAIAALGKPGARLFPVDKCIELSTDDDVATYRYWSRYFRLCDHHPR
ncbi:hypothetical protein AUJ68_06370 [Candidatus Woesearchaeota archaeon CG1_02_57_44]|nr:MAG: hypothetical protein AUJ68_06370 [Candidatus Woesearchaeota archaeon CG1_02_57_44]